MNRVLRGQKGSASGGSSRDKDRCAGEREEMSVATVANAKV